MRSLSERILVAEALTSVTTESAQLRDGSRCQWGVFLIWDVEVRYMRPISEERCTFSRSRVVPTVSSNVGTRRSAYNPPKAYEHDDGVNWPVSHLPNRHHHRGGEQGSKGIRARPEHPERHAWRSVRVRRHQTSMLHAVGDSCQPQTQGESGLSLGDQPRHGEERTGNAHKV